MVDAFKLIKQRYADSSNIKLFVIGNGEVRDSISMELMDYINNRVDIIHVDRVEYTNIYKYFALFSVMVLPSYREGFGMVTIECAAMGVPAIVSKSTGCIDSIEENKTGIYCDITAESIAKQIDYMIANPRIRKEMGEYARKIVVELYDSSVVWPHVIKVIEA